MRTFAPETVQPVHRVLEVEMRGIVNIVFGGIILVGALTGKLVLRGTNSSAALAVAGGALMAWGVFRFVQSRRQ
jgi:hypothetical protein